MQAEPTIMARQIELSEGAESQIRERIYKMEQFFDRILTCRVTVEGPGGHHRKGRYQLRLTVGVPGNDLVISHRAAETLELAIRDAFDAADRRLEDYVRHLRGEVKTNEARPTGRVARLLTDRECGFIESDGREIYFHRNAVHAPGYDQLDVGTEVRFTEVPGDEGPQASVVEVVGKGAH